MAFCAARSFLLQHGRCPACAEFPACKTCHWAQHLPLCPCVLQDFFLSLNCHPDAIYMHVTLPASRASCSGVDILGFVNLGFMIYVINFTRMRAGPVAGRSGLPPGRVLPARVSLPASRAPYSGNSSGGHQLPCAQDLSLGGLDCNPDAIYLRTTFRLQDLPASAPGPLSDFLLALGRAAPTRLMTALAPALNFSFVARPMQA